MSNVEKELKNNRLYAKKVWGQEWKNKLAIATIMRKNKKDLT